MLWESVVDGMLVYLYEIGGFREEVRMEYEKGVVKVVVVFVWSY